MKKHIKLTIFFALLTLCANAQSLELKGMLAQGVENNYSIRIVKASQQQAKNNATLANSGILPSVDLALSYDFDNDNYDITYRADNSELKYQNNDHAFDASVGLSWTIFDGFALQTNYKRYKELESQSQIATQIAIEDYIAQFTAEYFNNIKQQQCLKNLKAAMELSGERLRIVNARYSIGTFSRLDLLQAKVDFNVDSAAYIKQQEILYTSSINLSRMLAVDSLATAVKVQDSLILVKKSLDYYKLLDQTVTNNSLVLYANKNRDVANLNYKSILSRDYPYLKLSTSYAASFDMYSRNSTLKSTYHGLGATLSLGMSLFDPTKRAAKRNAIIDKSTAELEIKDLELELRAQFLTFWQAYVNNLQLLELETVSQEVAKENYEIANERYLLGNLSGIEMREAENSLLDAENRILDARYNTKICEISLLQISGNLEFYL